MSASASITRRRPSSTVEILNESTISPNNSETIIQRRSSQSSVRPRNPNLKPRLQVIINVLIKNLLLLILILGFVQLIRKLFIDGSGSVLLKGFDDLEGRIARVESSMKSTSKWLQVELDVVDVKIESLVADLRRDVDRRFDERVVELETRLKAVEAGVEVLRSIDSFSRQDLVKFYDELRKSKGVLGLDEVSDLVREMVMKEIGTHSAEGLGLVDYASASGGAMVVRHSKAWLGGNVGDWFMSLWHGDGVRGDADKMLKPSFGEPGQCFPLNGSRGFVEIQLRAAIIPEAVTLEHVDKSVAYDRSSAPKHCRVTGWLKEWGQQQGQDAKSIIDSEKTIFLTEFAYDLKKSNAQTINLFKSASSALVDTVRFEFSSNHGNPSFTCIYRFRVHGHEPNSIQMVASDS